MAKQSSRRLAYVQSMQAGVIGGQNQLCSLDGPANRRERRKLAAAKRGKIKDFYMLEV